MHAGQQLRASRHAALGDPARLTIVDELLLSDRSPKELQLRTGLPSNLLAHHLDVLEQVGLIARRRSSGDARRRYVTLDLKALDSLADRARLPEAGALFICTHNSARSQLGAALWEKLTGTPAISAGTEPADRIHPGAIAAAKRVGLDLGGRTPQALDSLASTPALVITVCDQAHEHITGHDDWLHWSIPDPVPDGRPAAFDAARDELRRRIQRMTGTAA